MKSLTVVAALALIVAAGCHRNLQYDNEAEHALGKSTGHDPTSVAMEPYKGQKTCPVSGKKLSQAEQPVALTVKGTTIYTCCPGCADTVKADPDAYLAKVVAERTKAAKPAVETTALNLGPYHGQQHCPVTGDPLSPDGTSRGLTVKGETVYVCCGACAMRLRSNPDKYIAKVQAERDAAVAKAQPTAAPAGEVRPVSDTAKPAPASETVLERTTGVE